ncbi:unnamed protein product [Strongylus vulgaris]|uniref:G-protein coupled receptors family 1 profile domain-containing protein n=1 Tax=Strongylus vulgaris TaxID=40348 RepID=A0A3P7I7U5_STRVU|nr:unnamed protein product [Strongylus vulgaris]
MILQDPIFDLGEKEYAVVLPALVIYCLLTSIGLFTVSIFIASLIETRDVLKEYPFFIIVWQVALSNALNLVAQATCIIPCTFLDARDGELLV